MRSGFVVSGSLALVLAGCDVETTTQAVELTADFSSMRVKAGRGSVALRPALDNETVRIEADLYGKNTSFSYEVDGDELVVKKDCRLIHLRPCWVDFVIYAPTDLDAEIDTSDGAVDVEDWEGALSVSTNEGAVSLYGGLGPTVIDTRSGAIELTWLEGDLEATSRSGTVRSVDMSSANVLVRTASGAVELEEITDFTSIDVGTGSGDVSITVPEGTYRVSVESGSGEASTSGVNTNSQATSSISVSTGSGDIDLNGV